MKRLREKKKTFQWFPYALYDTEVTFQQCNCPSGFMLEGKVYSNGKCKLYGRKAKVSLLPSGLALFCSKSYPGLVSNLTIKSNYADVYENYLRKSTVSSGILDHREKVQKYPFSWAVLWDKGNLGALDFICDVHPHRKQQNENIFVTEEARYELMSSGRVIVKNLFRLLRSIWFLLLHKYRWSHKVYDMCFKLMFGVTIYTYCGTV